MLWVPHTVTVNRVGAEGRTDSSSTPLKPHQAQNKSHESQRQKQSSQGGREKKREGGREGRSHCLISNCQGRVAGWRHSPFFLSIMWGGFFQDLEQEDYSDHDPCESRKACSLSEMNLSFLLGQKEGNETGSLSLMLHRAGRTWLAQPCHGLVLFCQAPCHLQTTTPLTDVLFWY